MAARIRKAPFRCPSCAFIQHEPEGLLSTYCRACGEHYEVRDHAAVHAAPQQAPRARRSIHCHRCGEDHDVAAAAKSTLCPGCGAAIEMGDLVFSSKVSRPVDTRGKLTVDKGAYLNTAVIVCGEGQIDGLVSGTIRCERVLRLGFSGSTSVRILTAERLVIEKNAQIDFLYEVHATHVEVHGKVSGTFLCGGGAHVHKHGRLSGRLKARSVIVDRGGELIAESEVLPPPEPRPSASREEWRETAEIRETGLPGIILPAQPLLAY